MRSLLRLVVVGGLWFGEGVRGAVPPMITPAPSVKEVGAIFKSPDAISLAEILLTAIPVSLRQIAATNIPAASSIIRDEFSQHKRPVWFNELPEDIQAYLIKNFGQSTARPTPPPGASASASGIESLSTALTAWPWPRETSAALSSGVSQAYSGATSSLKSTAPTPTVSSHPSTFATSVVSSSNKPSDTLSPSSSLHSTSSSQTRRPSSRPSPSSTPDAPAAATTAGLTRNQKIGLGVGIPVGILGAAAVFLACCSLLRRRRKNNITGSIPPSSPGFIPRFAFQEKAAENVEHQTPLTRNLSHSTQDLNHNASWEDEGIDATDAAPMHNPYMMNNAYTTTSTNPYTFNNQHFLHDGNAGAVSYSNLGIPINDSAPINHPTRPDPTPLVGFHTHSSNRARGMRTSYTSLRSVAEVSEPDDLESPVFGRHASPKHNPARSLMPTSAAVGAQIKRKPIGSPPSIPTSPAAAQALQELARQAMPDRSGSSSSGLALTTSTGNTSMSSLTPSPYHTQQQQNEEPISPISPISNRVPSNPFSYDSYVEDYGPEYHQSGYIDVEDGLYGNTSLSRYPEPSSTGTPKRKSSRGEWPLRSIVGSVKGHRRKSSPLWDRIYEE